MDTTEKTVAKNYVYRGAIINVRCDDALLPGGKPCKREIVEHRGGAADRKSTRLNSSHNNQSRMPSSA